MRAAPACAARRTPPPLPTRPCVRCCERTAREGRARTLCCKSESCQLVSRAPVHHSPSPRIVSGNARTHAAAGACGALLARPAPALRLRRCAVRSMRAARLLLLALCAVCCVLPAARAEYHVGDFVPAARRAQFHGVRRCRCVAVLRPRCS
jgi:hypothetical protein